MLTARHVRTTKAPHQPIPLFTEVLDILMMPENAHVKLNVSPRFNLIFSHRIVGR